MFKWPQTSVICSKIRLKLAARLHSILAQTGDFSRFPKMPDP